MYVRSPHGLCDAPPLGPSGGRDLGLVIGQSTFSPPDKYTDGGNGMNKWNRLLTVLDHVFGFKNKARSNFKKVSQGFDENTNEHVIVIEYRVQVEGTMRSTPSKQKVDQASMLQQLHAQGQANQNKKR
jgi:hypothetical protein